MREYTQPKIVLPINLHDAQIASVEWDNKIGGINKGNITINTKEGFLINGENGQYQSASGSVFYDDVDFDFCKINAYKEEQRKEIRFEQLERILKSTDVEIDEITSSYDLTKICCYAYSNEDYYIIEIEIYHEREAVYRWEE